MADIWLMRHGHYQGHRPGYHAPHDAALSAEGRAQVRGSLPLPANVVGIVTSPLLRAHQTAEIIAVHTGLPLLAVSETLCEWRAPSEVIGRTRESYPPGYEAWRRQRLKCPSSAYGDGESLTHLHQRALESADLLQDITDNCGSVLVVSHKILLGMLTGLFAGPTAFEEAAQAAWPFTERRLLETSGPAGGYHLA